MPPQPTTASPSQITAPPPLPTAQEILAHARAENFPVALKILRPPLRRDLMAIYGFARLVDNIGDNHPGGPADRLAALDLLEHELARAYTSQPTHEIFRRLQPTIQRHDLPRDEFAKLIEANRQDQIKSSYGDWPELMEYCRLSADPVGRLVLGVFGQATADNIALSDSICSALQVAEHLQDVGEDFASGRTYLPAADLQRHGCSPADLEADVRLSRASTELARVVCELAERAREMLRAGEPLVKALRGQHRLAIAGFVAGGHAALDAIRSAEGEVLSQLRKPTKPAFLRHFSRLLLP